MKQSYFIEVEKTEESLSIFYKKKLCGLILLVWVPLLVFSRLPSI